MRELDPSQSRLLVALTIAAAQRLGGETFLLEWDNGVRQMRMARVGNVVLLDHSADASGPRSINVYLVEVQEFTAAALGENDRLKNDQSFDGGKKFKIDPQRLLYSLQWKHNATPPDLHLQLVRDPHLWFDAVSLALLAELSRHDPQLRDSLRAACALTIRK
jgi:hypothetical protein